jgi:hypothetical protein
VRDARPRIARGVTILEEPASLGVSLREELYSLAFLSHPMSCARELRERDPDDEHCPARDKVLLVNGRSFGVLLRHEFVFAGLACCRGWPSGAVLLVLAASMLVAVLALDARRSGVARGVRAGPLRCPSRSRSWLPDAAASRLRPVGQVDHTVLV